MSYDNPIHAKTYAALGSRNNAEVRFKVSEAMKKYLTINAKMPNAQAQRFVDAIDFKTAADFNTSARKDTFDVKLFAAAEIPEPPRNLAVLGNVNFGRRKYTVMPHKLADGLSFGFHLWNPSTHKLEAFRDAIKAPQPIYKNERYLTAERRKRNLRVRAPAMKKTGRTK